MMQKTGNQNIYAMELDLASLASVRSFFERFIKLGYSSIYAVVCNAGLQIVNQTAYTEDGFEMTFGVNHLAHFLLVNLLLPVLVLFMRNVNSVNKSGKALSELVTNPQFDLISGKYFEGTKETLSSTLFYNKENAIDL